MNLDSKELPHIIIGAAMEVHKHLGRGLVKAAYKECLAHELKMRELMFVEDKEIEICYKERWIKCGFRVDFLVEELVLIQVYSADHLTQEHKDEMNNYLRLTNLETGLLINFNVSDLRTGVKRLIVASKQPEVPYKS